MTQAPTRPVDAAYLFGHSDPEIRRLRLQARLYDGHTEHALRTAGVRPGMRVLDVGCGPGDVSFLASRLVGPTGKVLGVDASADIVEHARYRAEELGIPNVSFEHTTISGIELDEPVDAVIGRFILAHLPEPTDAIRDLATHVRPGGLIAFGECDFTRSSGSVPETPLSRAVFDVAIKTYIGTGADPAAGVNLHQRFRRAGLGSPRLTMGAPIADADDEALSLLAESWRSVLPAAQKLDLVDDELADMDAFLPRVRGELATAEAIFIFPTLITAWARV